jgi:hypothetical protein
VLASRHGSWRQTVRVAILVTLAASGGCADFSLASVWPDWRNGSLQHEHNNFCGHGYLQGNLPNPCPRDFAGSEAWTGPTSENEIRWHDPWRGDRPYPERPMRWDIPGNGNPADRTLPGRAAPHDTNRYPERGAGEDERGVPHWPLKQGTPEQE